MPSWEIDHIDHDLSTVIHTFKPVNLSFNQRINDIGDITYEIPRQVTDINTDLPIWSDIREIGTLSGAGIGEYRSGYRLRRDDLVIQEGFITSRGGAWGSDTMSIGGKQYAHYLERRIFPFDPRPDPSPYGHISDFVINTPTGSGVVYQVSDTEIMTILAAILSVVAPMANTMPFTFSLTDTGITIDYDLDMGDTSTLMDLITTLAEQEPGFDWEMSNDRQFITYYPKKYGTPGGIVADPSTVIWTFDDTGWDGINDTDTCPNAAMGISFVSTGPGGTRVLGLGSGLSTQAGVGLGYEAAQEQFWLLEDVKQYGNISSPGQLRKLVQADLSLDVQPIHEISVDLNANLLDGFWTTFFPGLAIYLKCQLGWHTIDSPHQILEMECKISNQGDERVTLNVNQIYDTTGLTGFDGFTGLG